jgi:hypothetical protein
LLRFARNDMSTMDNPFRLSYNGGEISSLHAPRAATRGPASATPTLRAPDRFPLVPYARESGNVGFRPHRIRNSLTCGCPSPRGECVSYGLIGMARAGGRMAVNGRESSPRPFTASGGGFRRAGFAVSRTGRPATRGAVHCGSERTHGAVAMRFVLGS